MSIAVHAAANIAEIDPAQVNPEVAVDICRLAKQSLEFAAHTAIPGSLPQIRFEGWLAEIDTIIRLCQDPAIQDGWVRDGHRPDIYRRLAEIERNCYDLVLTNLENLEADNPMRQHVQRYQAARAEKNGWARRPTPSGRSNLRRWHHRLLQTRQVDTTAPRRRRPLE